MTGPAQRPSRGAVVQRQAAIRAYRSELFGCYDRYADKATGTEDSLLAP